MQKISCARDVSKLEISMDVWTEPFWRAAENGRLELPRCGQCKVYRWSPGPFCPRCHDQSVEWMPAGPGHLFSYTIVPGKPEREGDEDPAYVPVVIAFAQAGNIRMLGSLVDAPLDEIEIDAEVEVSWAEAANTKVPVFRLVGSTRGCSSHQGSPT